MTTNYDFMGDDELLRSVLGILRCAQNYMRVGWERLPGDQPVATGVNYWNGVVVGWVVMGY
ncbi:MAG: hypothetical protein N2D54_11110 [Chloroflexota bacterium]